MAADSMSGSSNRLLILSDEASDYAAIIRQLALPQLEVLATDQLDDALHLSAHCNIVLGEPHRVRHVLSGMAGLRWVQSNYVGVEPLLEIPRRDYILTNLGDLYRTVMTEYVFCYMLLHERRVLERYRAQLEGSWDSTISGSLEGRLLAILGVGSIGARIAETAVHFGMRTRGFTRNSEDCAFIGEYLHGDRLSDAVSGADYVVSTLPATPSTHHLIGDGILAAMAPSSLLVNIGRGEVIDEAALDRALRAGTIAGAVLDVFEDEPLPPSHPFWTAPNLWMTFHTAAPGPNYLQDIVEIFAENYRRLLAGVPLKNVVDFTSGY